MWKCRLGSLNNKPVAVSGAGPWVECVEGKKSENENTRGRGTRIRKQEEKNQNEDIREE
jgi:hypothetical protein